MLRNEREGLGRVKLLTMLLILSPFLDVINGWLMMNGRSGNVSASYKIIILAYIFYLIVNRINKKLVVFVFLLAISSIAQRLFLNIQAGFSINDYVKLLFPLVLLFAIKNVDPFERNKCVHSVLDFYSWFYPVSILIPTILGIGFHTYGTDGFGYKGFYYAGNELAGVILILLAYTIQCYVNKPTKKNITRLILMIFTGVIIGMKSLYVGIVVLAIVYFLQLLKDRKTIVWFVPAVVLAVVLLTFVLKSDFIQEFVQVQQIRFTYRISGKYENEFLAFMLSGRNDTVAKSLEGLWRFGGIPGILWGIGIDKITEIAGKITEMDFFDLFFWNGLFVAIWYFYLLGTELRQVWGRKGKFERVGILLMIAFSFFAGHVFYAPSVMIPLVLICLDSAMEIESE